MMRLILDSEDLFGSLHLTLKKEGQPNQCFIDTKGFCLICMSKTDQEAEVPPPPPPHKMSLESLEYWLGLKIRNVLGEMASLNPLFLGKLMEKGTTDFQAELCNVCGSTLETLAGLLIGGGQLGGEGQGGDVETEVVSVLQLLHMKLLESEVDRRMDAFCESMGVNPEGMDGKTRFGRVVRKAIIEKCTLRVLGVPLQSDGLASPHLCQPQAPIHQQVQSQQTQNGTDIPGGSNVGGVEQIELADIKDDESAQPGSCNREDQDQSLELDDGHLNEEDEVEKFSYLDPDPAQNSQSAPLNLELPLEYRKIHPFTVVRRNKREPKIRSRNGYNKQGPAPPQPPNFVKLRAGGAPIVCGKSPRVQGRLLPAPNYAEEETDDEEFDEDLGGTFTALPYARPYFKRFRSDDLSGEKCAFCMASFPDLEELKLHLDNQCGSGLQGSYNWETRYCSTCKFFYKHGYSSCEFIRHVKDCGGLGARPRKRSSKDSPVEVSSGVTDESEQSCPSPNENPENGNEQAEEEAARIANDEELDADTTVQGGSGTDNSGEVQTTAEKLRLSIRAKLGPRIRQYHDAFLRRKRNGRTSSSSPSTSEESSRDEGVDLGEEVSPPNEEVIGNERNLQNDSSSKQAGGEGGGANHYQSKSERKEIEVIQIDDDDDEEDSGIVELSDFEASATGSHSKRSSSSSAAVQSTGQIDKETPTSTANALKAAENPNLIPLSSVALGYSRQTIRLPNNNQLNNAPQIITID